MNITTKLAAALGCALDHVTPYDHPDAVSAREALAAYDARRLETESRVDDGLLLRQVGAKTYAWGHCAHCDKLAWHDAVRLRINAPDMISYSRERPDTVVAGAPEHADVDVRCVACGRLFTLTGHPQREPKAEKPGTAEPEGLLIVGNIVDGFQFVGPFACESDAAAYAQANGLPDWTTVTMRKRA